LISLTRKGYEVKCFAPALEIDECVTYTTKKSDPREERYMDVESARISRSQIENLKKLNEQDFDCLVIPGGEGALSNVSFYDFSLITKSSPIMHFILMSLRLYLNWNLQLKSFMLQR